MSLRDKQNEINPSYKKYSGTWLGHNLYILAEIKDSKARFFGSIFDYVGQCGPLIFVNMNNQRWARDCVVNFTYRRCIIGTNKTLNVRGDVVTTKGFVKNDTDLLPTVYTGSVTIPAGTQDYHQFKFHNPDYVDQTGTEIDKVLYDTHYAHVILTLSITDPLQEVKVYCMADDGMRLLDSFNDAEVQRSMIDILERSQFVSPPPCPLCSSTGLIDNGSGEDITCTDCDGYKFHGENAQGFFLKDKAERFGVKKRDETDESFQWRAWAKQWWIIPTQDRIKEYISHFTRVDKSKIQIEEKFFPEAIWTIRLPILSGGLNTVGDLLSPDDSTYNEIFGDLNPAGTSVVVRSYREYGDFDIFEEEGMKKTVVLDTDARWSWGMAWASESGEEAFGETDVDGCWFGNGVDGDWTNVVDSLGNPRTYADRLDAFDATKDFYEGVSLEAYKRIIKYDQIWVSGEVYIE